MAEAKWARRQVQRLTGKYIAGPRPRAAWKNDRINSAFAIHFGLDADQRCVSGRAVGIVAAGHTDFDVPEAFFRQMSLERGERISCLHVRNQAKIELRGCFPGENGFSARAGVAADE